MLLPTLLVSLLVALASGQFFLDNSLQPVIYQPGSGFPQEQDRGYAPAHRDVLENAARESQLPPELLNPFYKNPNIAAGLARESLIANKEFPVYHRDTENISRHEIFKIFQRAGFYDKNRRRR